MALPRGDPHPSVLEFARERFGESWEPLAMRLETLSGAQLRIALWLIAADALASYEYRLQEQMAGLRLLAFGLDSVDDVHGSLEVTAFVLPQALEDYARDELPRLSVPDADDSVEYINVVPEPWALTLHAPLNLRYGTLACWVKPHAGGEGVLTVRHAVASGVVHLDDGSVQPVLWYAPECLDAAVADAPSGQRPLTALSAVVPTVGDAVEVITKSGPQTRVVDKVGQTWGTVTAAIPHAFLLDQPLQFGDSGSLVRLSHGGDALGLYIGSLATSNGPRGFCQGLHQLDRLFTNAGHSSGFFEE